MAKHNFSITCQQDLIDAIHHVHGDKYDLTKTAFKGWYKKVMLTCHETDEFGNEHGDFEIDVTNLIAHGHGCQKCNGGRKHTQEEFIRKVKSIYGNYFTFEKTVYVNAETNVIVTDKYGVDHSYRPDNLTGKRRIKTREEKEKNRLKSIEKRKEDRKGHAEEDRQKRETKYIQRCQEIYGDEYTYKNIHYHNYESKIIVTHNIFGNMTVQAYDFIHRTNHYKNFTPKFYSYYTYDACKYFASMYEWFNDFKTNSPTAFNVAKKEGWINDFNWLKKKKREKDETRVYNKEHYVYAYIFPNNAVYVGRTYSPKQRDKSHRTPQKHSDGRITKQSVLLYSEATHQEIPPMTILESKLNLRDSCEMEDKWVKHYENIGYNIINKAKTGRYSGSIGTYVLIWDEDTIRQKAKEYKNITEFIKKHQGVKGHLTETLKDELFPNRMVHRKWTKDEAHQEAMKYSTYSEFRKNNLKCYDFSHNRGWIKEWFPDYQKKRRGYWTYEHCKEVATTCNSRGEFSKKEPTAYNVSLKNGWIEDFGLPKHLHKWTYEYCESIAKTCNKRIIFREKYPSLYSTSLKNKWINDFFPKQTWTKEQAYEEAMKYNTFKEFRENNNKCYIFSYKKGWVIEWFPEYQKRYKSYWTYERCKDVAKMYNSRTKFCKENPTAYQVARINGWIDDFNLPKLNCSGKTQSEQTKQKISQSMKQYWETVPDKEEYLELTKQK